jgi:hypothetical protein
MSVQSHQSQHHNRRRRPNVDVHIVNHHSIVLFHLTTPEASAWVEENVTAEAQFFGTALVVEPRCRRPHPRHARGRTGGAVMTYKVEITKVYFVQAESEGEAVQIALEMLESGKSVM